MVKTAMISSPIYRFFGPARVAGRFIERKNSAISRQISKRLPTENGL
jgi:hypothetical protein